MSEKTAKKTARSPRNGAEIPLGAHPGNTGGKKGRSGRKPNAFKEFAREVLESPETRAAIREAASNPGTHGYASLIKALAAYSDGLPVQAHEHTGKDGQPIQHEHKVIKWGELEVPI